MNTYVTLLLVVAFLLVVVFLLIHDFHSTEVSRGNEQESSMCENDRTTKKCVINFRGVKTTTNNKIICIFVFDSSD